MVAMADGKLAGSQESPATGKGPPEAEPKPKRRRRLAPSINGPDDHLRLYTPNDLALAPQRPAPLIRGVVSEGAYGPFGGMEKTLKSICSFAGGIALASGEDMLGFSRWSVPNAKPVLIFAGEGGWDLAHWRVRRIAHDIYGITDVAKIPLYIMEGVDEMNGEYFHQRTRDYVAAYGKPGLVILDSLYNFHDTGVEVSNLYARGGMLSRFQHFVQRECGRGCGLWVVDHFRKSARGTGLEEYQQAGMSQWADSWWNTAHRQPPDLDHNQFWLNVSIGSRHGYGGLYEIDVDEGPFDDDLNDWLRPMTATVRRVASHEKTRDGGADRKMSDTEIDGAIVELAESGHYTKTDIKENVRAGNSRVHARLRKLLDSAQLKVVSERRDGRQTDIVLPYGKVSVRGRSSRKSS